MKEFKVTDELQASIDSMKKKAQFGKVREAIKQLKEKNLPVYWDILYKHLDTGGDALTREYAERFAKEQHLDHKDVKTRNDLFEKFRMLHDPFHRFAFGKRFVTVHEDGSFKLNEQSIDEYYREQWTYTVTEEQEGAIEELCKAIDKLDISVTAIPKYFSKGENQKTQLIGKKIYAVLSGGQRSEL